MIKKLMAFALCLLILTGCSQGPKTGPDAGKNTETIQKLNKESKNENMDVNEEETGLIAQMKDFIVKVIEEGAKDYCKVETETKDGMFIIHLHPINEFKEVVIPILKKDEKAKLDQWKDMASEFQKASSELSKNLGQNISIQIHNPENEENIIYSTSNADITYNVVDELYPDKNK